jgi:hypothetical protein
LIPNTDAAADPRPTRTKETTMATIKIEIDTDEVSVKPGNGRSVILNFSAEKSDVLKHFDGEEVLEHFDRGTLLDVIGEEFAREHFGIEASED